jgi:phosphomannomutase
MALVESFSGIRGIFGKELTEETIIKYGQAYYQFLSFKNKKPKIVIGKDTRPSGKQVYDLLLKGLGECEIIDVEVLPTAAIGNAVRVFNCDGGIVITASHNEPEYNGFKFLDFDGAVLRSRDIDFVISKAHTINKTYINNEKNNVINKRDEAILEYKKFILEILKTDKINLNTRVLVDPNGGAGIISKEIFEDYGVNSEYINMEEGKFERLVEPNESSLKYLKDEIKIKDCEFAIGLDCDADRVEILLSDGSLVSGNDILALIAEEILSNSHDSKKTIVVNDATSYIVKETSEKYNTQFLEVEVGEINVVDGIYENNAQIGGEGSNGGVIIPPLKCRDGIVTLLVLLKLISKKNKTLKELIAELPKYYYFKEKMKIKEDFSSLREKIKEYYLKNGFQILETGDSTGGIKAVKNNSWVWFRQSKTEDKILRIIVDSKDKDVSLGLLEEARRLFG